MSVAGSVATLLARAIQAVERRLHGDVDPEQSTVEVAAALDAAMGCLRDLKYWGPANRMASNQFWRIAEPWLRHGALQVHARTKPRGYAGDFELLANICDQVCCTHPLGTAMDRYFLDQAAPQAVRDRTELLAQRLMARFTHSHSDPFRVASVGSGPAREVLLATRGLPAEQRRRLHVTLLDLDPQALDYAVVCLAPLLGERSVTVVRANISRLPKTPKLAQEISEADYLYCSGFFDYLTQAAAVDMLNLFWHSLAPGGELTVFNFSPANASRAYMEWIGNWYLTYRDEDTVRQLGALSDIENSCFRVQGLSRGALIELSAHRGDGS